METREKHDQQNGGTYCASTASRSAEIGAILGFFHGWDYEANFSYGASVAKLDRVTIWDPKQWHVFFWDILNWNTWKPRDFGIFWGYLNYIGFRQTFGVCI